MFTANQLTKKITHIYSDMGVNNIDIEVEKDKAKQAWVIHLEKDNHQLDHYLDEEEASLCMDGEHCLALGLDIAQLNKNIDGVQF